MSATVDVNVLIAATNASDPHHDQALELLGDLVGGRNLFHLFWPVLLGFVRIATHPRILPNPLSLQTALDNVGALLAVPHVRVHGEMEGFWDLVREAGLEVSGGNDVPDAHLVALMRQHGVSTIYTEDRGFRRFDGLDVRRIAR